MERFKTVPAGRRVLVLAGALVFFCLAAYGMSVLGYLDFAALSAPSNPASGGRVFFNTATSKLACLTSSGADCMPSGGGGGGATIAAGAFSSLPSCNTTAYVYSVNNSPLTALCDGSSNLTWKFYGVSMPGPLLLNSSFTDTLGSSATWGNATSGPMTVSASPITVNQARLKASPSGDFTATLYYGWDAAYPSGATQAGLFAVNAAKTKGALAAFTAQNGYFTVGAYTCNPIDSCSQSGEAVLRTAPTSTLIVRIVKGSIAANVDWSVDGGVTFNRIGGVFISSIDDVSFVGPQIISAGFSGTTGTFYGLDVQ